MIGFVAGFGRCGTALTLAMLAAGGLPIVGSAPIFETLRFTPGRTDAGWLSGQSGRILKWVCPLSTWCPEEAQGPVLWLDRDPEEQARSQVKLARAFGDRLPDPEAKVRAVAMHIRHKTSAAQSSAAKQGPVTRLSFESLLSDPLQSARKLAEVFRPFGQLDVGRAAAMVRGRSPECAPQMEVEVHALYRQLARHG